MIISDSDYAQIFDYLSLLENNLSLELKNIKISDYAFFDDYLEYKNFLISNLSTLERFMYYFSRLEVKE